MQFSNAKINFDPEKHIYTFEGGQIATSVTTWLKQFQTPFDPDGKITARYAKKHGKSVEQVRAEWQATADGSTDRGRMIHSWIEECIKIYYLEEQDEWALHAVEGDGLNIHNGLPFADIIKHIPLLKYHAADTQIYPEQIVGNTKLNIAGTIDLLLIQNGKFVIYDYKTNRLFRQTNEYGEMLLPPFENYQASHLNIYSIQICMYAHILETLGLKFSGGAIIHIDHENNVVKYPIIKTFLPIIQNLLQ